MFELEGIDVIMVVLLYVDIKAINIRIAVPFENIGVDIVILVDLLI